MGSGGRAPHLGPPAACQVRAIEHLASVCSNMPSPPEDLTPYQAYSDVVGSASGYSDDLAKNYTVLHSKAHVALPHRAGAAQPLADFLPPELRHMLQDERAMLRDPLEAESLIN